VPAENFSMDCLPPSPPVAKAVSPTAELLRAEETRYAALSDEAQELLTRRAADALTIFADAARPEAATRIQHKWREHQATRLATAAPTSEVSPAPAITPSAPSSSGSSSLAGRRRLFGLRTPATAAEASTPPPPATEEATSEVSADPLATPMSPVAPSSTRPTRQAPRRSLVGALTTTVVAPEGAPAGFRRTATCLAEKAMPWMPTSEATAADEPEREPTALELDLGSSTGAKASSAAAAPTSSRTAAPSKTIGIGLLPMLPLPLQGGSATSDLVSWSKSLGDSATPRTMQKSIDVHAMKKYTLRA